jgi:carboxypeptidase Taq
MPGEEIELLKEEMGQVIDLNAAMSVLHWDQETYMPPKAAPNRGRQLATLSALSHRMFTDNAMGERLKRLSDDESLNDDEKCLVRETLHDYDLATKLPEAFVETFSEEQSKAFQAWIPAREQSDFKQFQPYLEKVVELLRQKADYYGYEESPYDALMDEYEPGMKSSKVKTIFSELAEKQSVLVDEIVNSPNQPDVAWSQKHWDENAQWDFTLQVLKDMGYDFDAGRQDKSIHPFTINFDLYDVRITTRVHPEELFSCLTGSIHEGGHALYELGFLPSDQRTVLAQATSLGIHESQSRMWENVIGRSKPFWEHYTPAFQKQFSPDLDSISSDQIYRAINQVAPSLIRVEADECTYNLHIILRYEIEVGLIEGDIQVADIPEVWNAKMKSYLGLDVPDDTHGCLQDIHWSHGSIGYFPTYALGNLYASQLFEKMEEDLPDLWGNVGNGNFSAILGWLRTNVHEVGRRKTAEAIVQDASGKEPSAQPYLNYLRRKYGELYQL